MVLQPEISSYVHAFYHNNCSHRCSCCPHNCLIDIYLLKKELLHDFNPVELLALLLYSGEEFPRLSSPAKLCLGDKREIIFFP